MTRSGGLSHRSAMTLWLFEKKKSVHNIFRSKKKKKNKTRQAAFPHHFSLQEQI